MGSRVMTKVATYSQIMVDNLVLGFKIFISLLDGLCSLYIVIGTNVFVLSYSTFDSFWGGRSPRPGTPRWAGEFSFVNLDKWIYTNE